ncbi:hypothetical protein WA158_005266 [Blastocystis sp. Blastoise]
MLANGMQKPLTGAVKPLLTENEDCSSGKSIETVDIDNPIVYTDPLRESEVDLCNNNRDRCSDNGLNYSQNSFISDNDVFKCFSSSLPTDYENSQKELYFNGVSNYNDDTFIKVSIFNYVVKTNASSTDLNVFLETLRSFMGRFNNNYSINLPIGNTQDYIRSLYHDIPNKFFTPTYLYVCKQNTAIYGSSFQRNINGSMKCIYCGTVHKKEEMERVLYSPLISRITNMIKCNIYQSVCSVYKYNEVMEIINSHHLFEDDRLIGHYIYNGIPNDNDRNYYKSQYKYVNDIHLCCAMKQYKDIIEKVKADIILFCGIFTDEFSVYNRSIKGSHVLLNAVGIRILNLKSNKSSESQFCVPISFCPPSYLQTIIQFLYEEFEILINGYTIQYNDSLIKIQCLPINYTFDYKGGSVIGGASSTSNNFCNWCSISVERSLSMLHSGIQFLDEIIKRNYKIINAKTKLHIKENDKIIDSIPISCLQIQYKSTPVSFYHESLNSNNINNYNCISVCTKKSSMCISTSVHCPRLKQKKNVCSKKKLNPIYLSVSTNNCDLSLDGKSFKTDYKKNILHLLDISKVDKKKNIIELYPCIRISRVYGLNPDSLHLNINLSKEYYTYLLNNSTSYLSQTGLQVLNNENSTTHPISLNDKNINILKTRLDSIHSFKSFNKNNFCDILNPTFFSNLNGTNKFIAFSKYIIPLMHDYTYHDSKLVVFLENIFSILNNVMAVNIPYDLNCLLEFKKFIYLTLYKLEKCMPKELITTQDHILIHLLTSILYICVPSFQYTYTNERFFGISGRICSTKRSPGSHVLLKMISREVIEYSVFSKEMKNEMSTDDNIHDCYDINCGSYSFENPSEKPKPSREILLSIIYTLLVNNDDDFNKLINNEFFEKINMASNDIWEMLMYDKHLCQRILLWFKHIFENEFTCYDFGCASI